jgi:hypothetical protein
MSVFVHHRTDFGGECATNAMGDLKYKYLIINNLNIFYKYFINYNKPSKSFLNFSNQNLHKTYICNSSTIILTKILNIRQEFCLFNYLMLYQI